MASNGHDGDDEGEVAADDSHLFVSDYPAAGKRTEGHLPHAGDNGFGCAGVRSLRNNRMRRSGHSTLPPSGETSEQSPNITQDQYRSDSYSL